MSATTADLDRLIQRATPRVEDVRTVDRCDIIRRDHDHFTLNQVVDSADALEFSVDSFIRCMKELAMKAPETESAEASSNTSVARDVHGCARPVDGFIGRLKESEMKAPETESAEASSNTSMATAVHGLLRSLEGMRLMTTVATTAVVEPEGNVEACEPAAEASDGWQEAAAEAKKVGGECFKNKDLPAALTHYTTAIRSTPAGDESLSALYSNRSAVLLQLGHASAAFEDACRCAELAPEWPKGHFRRGCSLRQLERLEEAASAFRDGQALEPANKDWEREIDKTERQHRALPSTQARQLVWHLLPELLKAWVRTGGVEAWKSAKGGVLQVQVNGDLQDLGTPKWQLMRDSKSAAKAQTRYAFLDEKGYMANLAANLAASPSIDGIAVVDLNGQPLKIADIRTFTSASDAGSAAFHIDVKHGGKMVAIICRVCCDEEVRRFVSPHKDPPAPKGPVEGVLQMQARTGFSKALPRFLGFQSFPGGDLNFPIVDLERDAPDAVVGVK